MVFVIVFFNYSSFFIPEANPSNSQNEKTGDPHPLPKYRFLQHRLGSEPRSNAIRRAKIIPSKSERSKEQKFRPLSEQQVQKLGHLLPQTRNPIF